MSLAGPEIKMGLPPGTGVPSAKYEVMAAGRQGDVEGRWRAVKKARTARLDCCLRNKGWQLPAPALPPLAAAKKGLL